ncbi:hypothetical protein RLW55_01365 [Hyphomicrobium sp. B1]|uniref:hypothetical protein n=1 Tax=unclassified Hyphomicrobium TaxID=2619925 RepID=UPI00391B6C4C
MSLTHPADTSSPQDQTLLDGIPFPKVDQAAVLKWRERLIKAQQAVFAFDEAHAGDIEARVSKERFFLDLERRCAEARYEGELLPLPLV